MLKILWVLPKNTFPVNDGAKLANFSLLKSFSKLDLDLDVLVFNDTENNKQQYLDNFKINNLFFIKRSNYSNIFYKMLSLSINLLLAPFLPITTGTFRTINSVKNIRKILKLNKYDYIIFDGLHSYAGFIEPLKESKAQLVYRAHNVEADLWFTKASKQSNYILKKLLLWQGNLIQKLESALILKSRVVWTISNEDQVKFKKDNPKCNFKNIFVGMEFSNKLLKVKSENKNKISLMFIGKLDWDPNKDGLKWFLSKVWPSINSNVELIIAGSGDSSWSNDLFDQRNIKFLGFVKDIDELYNRCDFSIIPIQYGSGTRIKVIESVSKSMPVISTSMGVQGSGLEIEDYLNAETASEWINLINSIDLEMGLEKASNAYLKLKNIYNADQISQIAYSTLL